MEYGVNLSMAGMIMKKADAEHKLALSGAQRKVLCTYSLCIIGRITVADQPLDNRSEGKTVPSYHEGAQFRAASTNAARPALEELYKNGYPEPVATTSSRITQIGLLHFGLATSEYSDENTWNA